MAIKNIVLEIINYSHVRRKLWQIIIPENTSNRFSRFGFSFEFDNKNNHKIKIHYDYGNFTLYIKL